MHAYRLERGAMSEITLILASFAVFAVLLVLLVGVSQVARVVFKEVLLHPFISSRVRIEDGTVSVSRGDAASPHTQQ
jgi:hypothetical protein